MQLSGPVSLSAPQITGHPHGLPGTTEDLAPSQKVQPILDARRPETQLGNHTPPQAFWHKAQGEPHPQTHDGPPSIMQIKISQMLNEQASMLAKADAPEAEQARVETTEPVFLPFESRKPRDEKARAEDVVKAPEPRATPEPKPPQDHQSPTGAKAEPAALRLPAYEEAANF